MTAKKPSVTWGLLAAALGLSAPTLIKYRARPDAPSCKDLDTWKAYLRKHDLGWAYNKLPTAADERRRIEAELEVRRLQ